MLTLFEALESGMEKKGAKDYWTLPYKYFGKGPYSICLSSIDVLPNRKLSYFSSFLLS